MNYTTTEAVVRNNCVTQGGSHYEKNFIFYPGITVMPYIGIVDFCIRFVRKFIKL